MSVLRISRLAMVGLFALGLTTLLAPSALAQYGGAPGGSGSSVTAGQDFTASFPAGSGFLPNEIVDGVLQPSGNVSGASYMPTSPGAVKLVSTTTTMVVESAVFTPRSAQTVTVKGKTNPDGSVSLAFPTTGLPTGSYTVTVTGETSHRSASVSFSVVPPANGVGGVAAGSNPPTSTGTGSGLLAFTGAASVAPLAIGGVALVAAGAGAVMLTRRRKVDA